MMGTSLSGACPLNAARANASAVAVGFDDGGIGIGVPGPPMPAGRLPRPSRIEGGTPRGVLPAPAAVACALLSVITEFADCVPSAAAATSAAPAEPALTAALAPAARSVTVCTALMPAPAMPSTRCVPGRADARADPGRD